MDRQTTGQTEGIPLNIPSNNGHIIKLVKKFKIRKSNDKEI